MLKLEWFVAPLGIPKMGPKGAGTYFLGVRVATVAGIMK